MKKIFLALAVVTLVLVSFTSLQKEAIKENVQSEITGSFDGNVDTASSVLLWKGFKPTGSHNGTVKLASGTIKVKRGKLKSGEFVIDMTSIKDADGSKRLEGHLKSGDFFGVEKFPTSKFVITKVKNKGGKLAVTGDLTVKGITKSITIPAMLSEAGGVITFKSETFKVNRADFNVRYGSKSFFDNLKNKFINDLMELSFTVKTVK